MLGSAVNSSTPTDFQPRSTMLRSEFPLMNRQGPLPGPTMGCPYCAVGMHRALESAIGLPRRSINALRMLAFLTPADVSRSLKMPPDSSALQRPAASAEFRDRRLADLPACLVMCGHDEIGSRAVRDDHGLETVARLRRHCGEARRVPAGEHSPGRHLGRPVPADVHGGAARRVAPQGHRWLARRVPGPIPGECPVRLVAVRKLS